MYIKSAEMIFLKYFLRINLNFIIKDIIYAYYIFFYFYKIQIILCLLLFYNFLFHLGLNYLIIRDYYRNHYL
jgi:hypothetical protein